jgi:SAM-dependent methyltransferase
MLPFKNRYVSATSGSNDLRTLQAEMSRYYSNEVYHKDWADGFNKEWGERHAPQRIAASLIPEGSTVLEVGCGAGDAGHELSRRIPNLRYIGVDLNWRLWPNREGFVSASATSLPFCAGAVDIVISMNVVEHLCYPQLFLDQAWLMARLGVIVIAPDFSNHGMASEWVGLSYGAGREKARAGRYLDAVLTGIGNKWIAKQRARRARRLHSGKTEFPILLNPRCLSLPDWVPDCDAIYPACPRELLNHYSCKPDFRLGSEFYKDASTFGVVFWKKLGETPAFDPDFHLNRGA